MTTTTMHFGPEWMRTKQAAPTRTAPSPPLTTPPNSNGNNNTSSYSSLVAPSLHPAPDPHDLVRPFRFSKDELLRIYKEGGGRGGLGLEVERWEGIVRELGSDPISLKEMSEGEKKIFAGPLNSEVRRRQSVDYLSPLSTERPKLGHLNSSGPGSPLRERMGNFAGRRRDSTDQNILPLPRKQSLSSIQAPLQSPRDAPLPSPRTRVGASGFDGGVLDGSWTSKRRAAEALAKAGGKPERESERPGGEEQIKEEEELPPKLATPDDPNSSLQSTLSHEQQASQMPKSEGPSARHSPNVDRPSSEILSGTPGAMPTGPPPGLADLASVEWSYLDPQGQVQGPFRADVMQKWYDDGYFTQELLMKRTHLETDWTPVRVLQQLAANTPIFLTPVAPHLPELQSDLDFASPNGPHFEPEPLRPFAAPVLNPRPQETSSLSGSPVSSYSNPHLSSGSPEPSTLAARAVNGVHSDMSGSYSSLNSLDPQRHSPAHDLIAPVGRSHVTNPNYGRNGRFDSFGFNGYNDIHPSVSSSFGSNVDRVGGLNGYQGPPSDLAGAASFPGNPLLGYGPSADGPGSLNSLRYDPRDIPARYPPANLGNGPGSPFGVSHFMSQPDMRTLQQPLPSFPPRNVPLQQPLQQPFLQQPSPSTQAARVAQDPLVFHPGLFDVAYPNAVVQHVSAVPSQTSPFVTQTSQPNVVPLDHSSWVAPLQNVIPESWSEEPDDLPANVTEEQEQPNFQPEERGQETQSEVIPDSVTVDESISQSEPEAPDSLSSPSSPVPDVTASAPSPPEPSRLKSRRKSNAPVVTKSTYAPSPPPAKPPTPSPTPLEHKPPAWSIDEDKLGAPSTVTSLREIQEAEARKVEARKAAERERVATRTASLPSTSEPAQSFATSWGLPTSQAGSSRPIPINKEPSGPLPSPASQVQPPVWTTTGRPTSAKKTMKEIQEEEEKRKKLAAKEKETVAAAARRAHTDAPQKVPPVSQIGGPWTTVGPSGRTSAISATVVAPSPATRPTVPASSKPAPAVPTIVSPVPTRSASAGAVTQRTAAVVAATKLPTKVIDESPTPSTDFLKWLGDALKGLNPTVNLEEIASMLLQFPVDPDSSTMEIISDLIYANSTTLDGRRFAAEFVSRRKASIKSTPGAAPVGKPISIADVVKTQPKPAQNEWGGFKVVNKKKKGSRA